MGVVAFRFIFTRLLIRERNTNINLLLEDWTAGRLQYAVDEANAAYGHGIARTNDFGFNEGENMTRDVPLEVRAQKRMLEMSL